MCRLWKATMPMFRYYGVDFRALDTEVVGGGDLLMDMNNAKLNHFYIHLGFLFM